MKIFSSVKAAIVLVLSALLFSAAALPVSATAPAEPASLGPDTVVFSNFQDMAYGETRSITVAEADGETAVISIEKAVPSRADLFASAGAESIKVSYTAGTINCGFYMSVSNNTVQSVSDKWISVTGGSHQNALLTRTTTYGKLSFDVRLLGGFSNMSCWLKGTVTGSNNQITITRQM